MPTKRIAVYPGTFDPPTNGHIDVAHRASSIFDELVVAVSDNPAKKPLFSTAERMELLSQLFKDIPGIRIESFSRLLVDFVKDNKAMAIVRGLRAVSDFEYELQMASMNAHLDGSIETVFFMASDENLFVSSSMVKEIVRLGGNISSKVHPLVMESLKKKLVIQ